MTEFIGSRISLISKRDIRYVGTLHEISSENSTVALEQVISYGTEGRRPEDEVPASDNVYEYIVFRGSDVKDLRIEEGPKDAQPPKPPQVPDDPAILGSARRPTSTSTLQGAQTQAPSAAQAQPGKTQQPPPPNPVSQHPQHAQQRQHPPPHFQQQPPFPYPYPPNQRFGPQGFPPGPPGPGYPGMPYGAPPGWYPPPGYGFPPMPPGQFHPHQMPVGPPGQPPRQPGPQPPSGAPSGLAPASNKVDNKAVAKEDSPKGIAKVKLPTASNTPVPQRIVQDAPPPPVKSKPDVEAALAPPTPAGNTAPLTTVTGASSELKGKGIVPAIPFPSKTTQLTPNGALNATSGNVPQTGASTASAPPVNSKAGKTIEEANRDARAAVAAAMAKLPPAPRHKKAAESGGAMDNLTRKVNEMRTNDHARPSRQPGTGEYVANHRGGQRGRGGSRGGRGQGEQQGRKMEVPKTDYDFEAANAKFNKPDLVKEAIAGGSPAGTPTDANMPNGADFDSEDNTSRKESEASMTIPVGISYNKSSSFFDNISSETKDRTSDMGQRLGGREFRNEERSKNLETFGQGSVDNNYRSGFRGRGRGRGSGKGGRGGRGRVNPVQNGNTTEI